MSSFNDDTQLATSFSQFEIRNSSLQATAPEFQPGGTFPSSTGAVRKKPQNTNRRNNYYGSGRINRYDEQNDQDYGENSRNGNRRVYENRQYRNYNENYKKNYRRNYDTNVGRENNVEKRENTKYFNKKYPVNQNNWRKPKNVLYKEERKNFKNNKKLNAASQRERLSDMLNRRQLECCVCCEKIKNADKVWSCQQCYNILHLDCTIAWAKSSQIENGWRCPACQNVCTKLPHEYLCYCGKIVDPKCDNGIIAHSCGEVCLRTTRQCDHKCTILCHPGPCPDCVVMVMKSCACGSTKSQLKCSTDLEIVCNNKCNKLLSCGLHKCEETCHYGDCPPCLKTIEQECWCGQVGRRVKCTIEQNGGKFYSCNEICNKLLQCGNHKCTKICHEGDCDVCPKDVKLTKTCPCGKMELKSERKSCLDPIPCCNKVCGKFLKCGQPNNPHTCESLCHEGDCSVCTKTTFVRCRCGHMDKELPCKELVSKADDARCGKKCTKKRHCGKHKCNQRCCIDIDHICPLPCNHQLSCGQHRCQLTCHRGHCPPCLETSFDELYCECGSSVLYPPIPCGTKPPICNQPCIRQRQCGHESNHACHIGPCPPCTILCKRWCYGRHEQRSAIPCHQNEFSCGLPCGKNMSCGRHKCIKACHTGDCPLPCRQPCIIPRQLCGHPCSKPCHDGPCPESVCKFMVNVTCQCGLQKSTKPCNDLTAEFRMIEMERIKDKIGEVNKGNVVDLSDVMKINKPTILRVLECNEECRVYERNRRLAIGLQIRNPDLSQKLTPRYSDFMRTWAKKDPHFCQRIHEKLTELVQLAKQSKQTSRSYSFESMNRDKRHFVHEYCEHFGCDSAAYDSEPNRNVVATASKEKSWLPSMSLMELIQRENGQRKVPGPILTKSSTSKSESVSLKLPQRSYAMSTTSSGEMADYYDQEH